MASEDDLGGSWAAVWAWSVCMTAVRADELVEEFGHSVVRRPVLAVWELHVAKECASVPTRGDGGYVEVLLQLVLRSHVRPESSASVSC